MQPRVHFSRSKLHRPRLAPDLIRRTRLLEWFAASQTKPVILLVAPVGFGKTSLLGTWSASAPFPCAWLTLDADDNDLRRFTQYLVAAVRTVFPGSLTSTTDLVNAPVLVDSARLATTLINELDELPSDFYLILDNYHLLRDKTVTALMSQLIRHLPVQVRLIISAHTDSPLPLSRLRAAGEVAELRSGDLRFTLEETQEFFRNTLSTQLSPESVRLLHQRTDGWVINLRFALLLFREGADPQQVVTRLTHSGKNHLMDHMLNEILSEHPPSVRQLILQTSLLERFTAGLCRALAVDGGAAESHAMLESLVRGETLVELREDNRVWFRYQTLLGEFLRARALKLLDAPVILRVYQQAVAWYAAHGHISEAIEYAIKAGDTTTATQLVGKHLHPTLNSEAGPPVLERWLGLFPSELLDQNLDLVRAQLWLAVLQFRLTDLPELADTARQLLTKADLDQGPRREAVESDIACALAAWAQWTSDSLTTVTIAARHYPTIPATHEYARASMLTELSMAHQMMGHTERALQVLTDALRKDYSPTSDLTRRALVGYAGVHLNNADFENLARVSERLLQMAQAHSPASVVSARYLLGLVHYEWNMLETAAQHLEAAGAQRHRANVRPAYESLAWLALTQQAQGKTGAANQTRRELERYARELGTGSLLYHQAAYCARLDLMQGNLETALAWASSVGVTSRPHMVYETETNLTRLMILLASGRPELVREMLNETGALLEQAAALHNKRRLIQLHALEAMALETLGKRGAALDSLETAIRLGEPGGFVRTFLDLGPEMLALLNRLVSRSKATPYLKRILSAASNGRPEQPTNTIENKSTGRRAVETLTLRERQVLEHLALRLSDKEIARALVISPLTVKAHTDHIYQKLGVNSRQAAVKVGFQEGIIAPDAIPGSKT